MARMNEKPRRLQFSLRMLFALVTVCAFLALVGPPTASWLFPPDPDFGSESAMNDPEFRELMRLVEQSLQKPHGESSIVVTHGEGLTLPDQE